jgi:hypothetical protein
MFVSTLRSVGGCRCRGGRGRAAIAGSGTATAVGLPLSPGGWPVRWRKTSSSVGLREKAWFGCRPPDSEVADANPRTTELGGRLFDEDKALARRRQGQPVRTPVFLRDAAADPSERCLGLVALSDVEQFDLEDLAANAVLELVARSLGDHAAVVDHGDLVRELIGLLEVLRRQQNRRAFAAQVADDRPDLVATSRIEAGGRLVEEEHAWPGEQARCEVKSPAHPARVGLRGSIGGVGELEALEQLRCAIARFRAGEAEQASEHLQVLAACEQLVDGGELTGQGEELAHLRRLRDDVVSEELGPARVGLEQRGQDADERRLARPVRAEQAEDHPLRNLQIDAGQSRGLSELLDDALDPNRELRRRAHGAAEITRSADSSHSRARCAVV